MIFNLYFTHISVFQKTACFLKIFIQDHFLMMDRSEDFNKVLACSMELVSRDIQKESK